MFHGLLIFYFVELTIKPSLNSKLVPAHIHLMETVGVDSNLDGMQTGQPESTLGATAAPPGGNL